MTVSLLVVVALLALAWSAFCSGAEQDYYQVQLDRALQEVFGDELQPFETRYPYIKEQKYGRRK